MKNYRHIKKIIPIVVMGTFLFQMNLWLHAQSEGEIVRQFQKAKNRYLNGQYVNAKTRIERIISIIIEKDISRSDILGGCYLMLGAIYEKEGKPDLAEENYRKATGNCGIMKVEGVDLGSLNLYRKIIKGGIIVHPGTKPKKKFPWLLLAVGVVMVLVVYFLLLKPKKKYPLSLEWGEGVNGELGE
jgi:hypothetical protein